MTYSKFIEVTGKDIAKDFGFVAKAVSTDETRYFLNNVYCEENKLIATDGRRMHILDLKGNPYGFEEKKHYRVLKTTLTIVWFAELSEAPGDFPNWKRVIPERKTAEKTFKYESATSTDFYGEGYQQITKLIRNIPAQNCLNLKFVQDLKKSTEWTVYTYGTNKPIEFVSDELTAIIMPMQMED